MYDYRFNKEGRLICPKCGATDAWVSSWINYESSTVEIIRGEYGHPYCTNYSSYGDSEPSQDEAWTCQNYQDGEYCNFAYRFGRFEFVKEKPAIARARTQIDQWCNVEKGEGPELENLRERAQTLIDVLLAVVEEAS